MTEQECAAVTRSRREPRRATWRRGLFAKYWLLIFSLVTGALLASGAVGTYFSYQENKTAIATLQREQAVFAAYRIEQYIRRIHQQITYAAQPQFDADLEVRRIEFLKLLRQLPEVTDVVQIDGQGREQIAVSRLAVNVLASGKDLSRDPAFVNAKVGESWFSPVYFRKDTEPYVVMAIRPAREGDWVTVAHVSLKFIWDVVSRIRIGEKGKAYVVDSQGLLVADPDIGLVLRKTELSALPHVSAAVNMKAGDDPVMVSRNLAGTTVLTSYASIDLLGWKAFVEQPVSEVYAKLDASILRMGLLLLAGFGVSTVASLLLARSITRPILRLQRGAANIATGDLQSRIRVQTGDEIEALATEFNRMASRLQESYADLDAKIQERTRELTEANVKLGLKRKEADRANAAKTRFLAAASHDLRQPLHSVSLLVGILRDRMSSVELATLVDKVQLSVQAMESLFKSLLDISKLDAGVVVPSVSAFDVGTLLQSIETNYGPQAHEKGLAFHVVPSAAFVRSDPVLLERIVGNLVSNAIRYTNHGRVLVGCRRHKGAMRIMVIDTGIGIASANIDEIFDEFFQLSNPERDRSKGLGLGLSIVKRAAELLGHPLIVRSRPGKGSTFAVEVERAQRAQELLPRESSGADEGASLDGAFVAVVDDDQENRYATEALCTQWNCHVVSGASATEIVAKLAHHLRAPDLVITDYQLRDHETGLDVIAKIREHAEQEIPAIIVSGAASPADVELIAKSGFELLEKPVDPSQLRRAMRRLLAVTKDCAASD